MVVISQWVFIPIGFVIAVIFALYFYSTVLESVFVIHYYDADALASFAVCVFGILVAVFGLIPYLPKLVIMP
jgi:hypothetical protein